MKLNTIFIPLSALTALRKFKMVYSGKTMVAINIPCSLAVKAESLETLLKGL